MKTLVIGNGIDIQFGGMEQRGNSAIMRRVISNVQSDKYCNIGMKKEEVEFIIQVCTDVFNKIISYSIEIPDTYLFLQIELERIRKSYKKNVTFEEIGLEDLLICTEVLYHYCNNDEERKECISAVRDYITPIIIDAIFDDGNVNEIYRKFPKKFIQYLKSYDAIFTLNYDTNIESAIGDIVPVYHIHGCFDDYVDRAGNVVDEFKHMFCNGILSWYWLEKYGKESEDKRYHIDALNNIEDRIDILGISPCNDEQLYLRLSQNTKLKRCNYYYLKKDEAIEIRKHLGGNIRNHVTDVDVKKFWKKMN